MAQRTDNEILDKIRAIEATGADWLGTQRGDLINYLPFSAAKPFLKPGVDEAGWFECQEHRDENSIKAAMLKYMPFAWDKANNNRGLSAGRSLDHMSASLWMLGLDDAATAILDYDLYGKPHLRAICEAFGWDWRQWDDGRWTSEEAEDGHAPPETVKSLPGMGAQEGGD